MNSRLLLFILIFFFARSNPVEAQAPVAADVESLRTQIEALKADYEKRIQSLESQLEEIQTQMLSVSSAAETPVAPPPAPPTMPGALNPAISVIGNFVGRTDDERVFNAEGERIDDSMNLREAEMDLRVPVDPYADGVLIMSLESETPGRFIVDVEEGYVNVKRLPFMESPLGLKFQVGRFRPAFGKFNMLHTHDLPTTERSLVTKEFLGEDGFISQGVSSDFFVPTPWDEDSSLNVRIQVLTGGDIPVSPLSHNRLAYLGNLRWFKTFADTHNLDVSWSSYLHPGRQGVAPMARLHGVDLLYRWKPFRQGEWKSYLLGGEFVFTDRVFTDRAAESQKRPYGATMFTQWQFDRRKYAGVRWDYTTTLADPLAIRRSLTPYFTYYFSEFLRFRIDYEHFWSDIAAENSRNTVFFELNWIFGAHPPEPFWVNR